MEGLASVSDATCARMNVPDAPYPFRLLFGMREADVTGTRQAGKAGMAGMAGDAGVAYIDTTCADCTQAHDGRPLCRRLVLSSQNSTRGSQVATGGASQISAMASAWSRMKGTTP